MTCSSKRPRVDILHPGYKQNHNVLLTFSACDVPLIPWSQGEIWGLHHGTALTAGAIITNNIFDQVYFSHDQLGKNRIETPREGILAPGCYYLQVRKESLMPTFEDWQFPHGKLPPEWDEQHLISPRECHHEKRCYATGLEMGLEKCYVVPSGTNDWFVDNGMNTYSENIRFGRPIDDEANKITLMSHIRSTFDDRTFVIVPKPSSRSPGSKSPSSTPTASTADHQPHEFAVHVISTCSKPAVQFADFYHNLTIQPQYIHTVRREFLFARFAWAIFPLLRQFLDSRLDRYLLVTVDGELRPRSMHPRQYKKYMDENLVMSRKRQYESDTSCADSAYVKRWRQHSASRETSSSVSDADVEDLLDLSESGWE
ncbi:hypothetical protein EV127DRAFT_340158 [Xylaria flabelliformis]|nr:hypothetical protein EV127DRAFT_340158 [Xylaria flabelliformis]